MRSIFLISLLLLLLPLSLSFLLIPAKKRRGNESGHKILNIGEQYATFETIKNFSQQYFFYFSVFKLPFHFMAVRSPFFTFRFLFSSFPFAEIRSYNMRKLQDYDTGIGESTTTISPLGSPQPSRSSTSSSSSSTASASTPIAAKPSSYFANHLQVKLIGLHLFI